MRKEQVITLQDGGEEKKFKIKQMSASSAEKWLIKLILLIGGKAEIEKMEDMNGLLEAISGQPYEKVQELLDGLLSCVSRVHDGGIESQLTPDNADGFIEEMGTLLKLRMEAFNINAFFQRSGMSGSSPSQGQKIPTIKRKK